MQRRIGSEVIAPAVCLSLVTIHSTAVPRYYSCTPAGPGFTVKRPIRKQELAPALLSRLILLLLASRIWRALHESVNFVHDPEKQYKSLSVAHRPGGLQRQITEFSASMMVWAGSRARCCFTRFTVACWAVRASMAHRSSVTHQC